MGNESIARGLLAAWAKAGVEAMLMTNKLVVIRLNKKILAARSLAFDGDRKKWFVIIFK